MRIGHILIVFLLVAILATAAVMAWWFILAGETRAAIETWVAERQAEGFEAGYDELRIDGFPFRVTARITAPALARMDAFPTFRWTAPALVLSAPVWRPNAIDFDLVRPAVSDLATTPGAEPVQATAERVSGVAQPDADAGEQDRWHAQGRLQALHVERQGVIGPPLTVEEIRGSMAFPVGTPPAAGPWAPLQLAIEAKEILLPRPTPLGTDIARLAFDAAITTPLPVDRSPQALAAWRTSGGEIAIDSAGLRWGPLAFEAEGQLGLDAMLRPAGSITARVRGFGKTVDTLAQSGLISPDSAPMLKTVLALLSRGNGAGREIEARLIFDQGWLSLGPLRIAPLEPLTRAAPG